jgi:hypothetical protein
MLYRVFAESLVARIVRNASSGAGVLPQQSTILDGARTTSDEDD